MKDKSAAKQKRLRESGSIRTARFPTAAAILIAVTACGCDFLNPNRQIKTLDRPVRLIDPSPAVDSLLAHQRVQDEENERFWREPHSKEEGLNRVQEMLANPERYYPGRSTFLLTMAQQPGESIPAGSYLRLLETSRVKCSKPFFTTDFIKVRVTSGLLVGRVGWVCEDDVFRTVAMP
jgi:hypothetical protein